MKKERPPLDKKGYWKIVGTAIALMVSGFLLIGIGAPICQAAGVDDAFAIVFIVLFFAMLIAALVLLIGNFKRLHAYELEKDAQKRNAQSFTVADGVTKESVVNACARENFAEKDGGIYYHKRAASAVKDYVNYFIRFVDYTELKGDLEREYKLFDGRNYSQANKCLLLFAFSDEVTESDFEIAKEQANTFIAQERYVAVNGLVRWDTAVIVLVDTTKRQAYFFPDAKGSLTLYSRGIKMTKKLTSAK